MDQLRLSIEELARDKGSPAAMNQILEAGPEGMQALKTGLLDNNWRIRLACAEAMDHHADATCLEPLLSAIHDGMEVVRRRALHSIGCQLCKKEALNVDLIPLLTDALLNDRSLKVRRTCANTLGGQAPDARAIQPLRQALEKETDRKLRHLAGIALQKHSEAFQ